MNKRKFSAVVFDLGNVLLPFDHGIIIDKLNSIKPELGKRFYKYYTDNYNIHRNFEKGILPEEKFLKLMLDACENKITEIEFCKIYSDVFTVNEEVASLLPKLKSNYKLFLLSNTNTIHKKFGYEHYTFLNYFDRLFLSFEVKALKPEPEIYKAVENYSKILSEEIIFIDDIKEYVDGAKLCGWDGIQFFNYNQLIEDFRKRDIHY